MTRIIVAASAPGDIVLDCFIGSGTTAAVAQKLGRRWIGCDINKGAIQTTANRLQGIMREQAEALAPAAQPRLVEAPKATEDEPAAPPAQLAFGVWRVNDYDLQIQHNEAANLAAEYLGIERTRTDAYFDGTLHNSKRLVKIVSFNHPLSPLDLEEVKRELDARPDEDRPMTLVCLGIELAAQAWIEEWNRLRKGRDAVNRIDVVELRTDPRYGGFLAHKPATARVKVKRQKDTLHVEIADFHLARHPGAAGPAGRAAAGAQDRRLARLGGQRDDRPDLRRPGVQGGAGRRARAQGRFGGWQLRAACARRPDYDCGENHRYAGRGSAERCGGYGLACMKGYYNLMAARLTHAIVRITAVLGVLVAALWLMLAHAGPARAAGLVTDCTEQGLADAMNLGSGLITFDCGPNPVIIPWTVNQNGLNVIPGSYYTIDGGNLVTLSGNGLHRLFDVRVNGALTLTNLILTEGYTDVLGNLPGWGGAILAEGNRLVLDHVTIRNSQSPDAGGAIRVVTGTALIQNSLIENNQSGNGGGVYSDGALTMVNTLVRGNHALSGDGGGLFVHGTAVISQSQILSNTALVSGGGIENLGTLTLSNTSQSHNAADVGGGLANAISGQATLDRVTFSGNAAGSYSGGLDNTGVLTLTNASVSGNHAPANGSGGGLGAGGNAHTTVADSTFTGNFAGSAGGVASAGGPFSLTNVTFSGNSATNGDGGGLHATYGIATLLNVTFSGNSATGNGGGFFLAAISASDSLTLTNTLLAASGATGNCYIAFGSETNFASAGYNLSDDHSCDTYFIQTGDQNNQPALLLPLANNGGFTLTHLPRHTSPAVDHGPTLGCPAADQRGQPRPAGAACDIGAVEVQPTDRAWLLDLPALWR